jgi:hypothetical protein
VDEVEKELATQVTRHQRQPLQSTRSQRKAQQQSRTALILDAMPASTRELYAQGSEGQLDLSYTSPRRWKAGGIPGRASKSQPPSANASQQMPLSLHNILARYIETVTLSPWAKGELRLSEQELAFLKVKGYSQKSVERWATSLIKPPSLKSAELFQPGNLMPPFFVVLLFLRRKQIQPLAFGIVMRHVELRLQTEHINWIELKILLIRMVRHARQIWPESIPWIASVFTSEATRIMDGTQDNSGLSPKMLSDVVHFCNKFLSLLSLPSSLHPIISALHQEKAQFQVLHFMANCSPALIVTRVGFRAVVRNQLAHKKTSEEREWAKLKGETWPPWKENRNAMDEDKGYDFGTSRASRILHRMFEAGYGSRAWEQGAEIYAGWDTDLSPTIQTRTSLPQMSTQYGSQKRLETTLWAARIRTTRTRREAWACFLAYEASGAPTHGQVYHAMFEKIHYHEMEEHEPDSDLPDTMLLPGDSKELLPDPASPLNLVYISEPIPTLEQLYYRMVAKSVRPKHKFLAFLLQVSVDYDMFIQLLESAKDDFGGEIGRFLDGSCLAETASQQLPQLPSYMAGALIKALCHFGSFSRSIPTVPFYVVSPAHHKERFRTDRQYLLEYAHAFLLRYKPRYLPAWTAYMQKVVYIQMKPTPHRRHDISVQYRVICDLVEKMAEEYIDLDHESFQLYCLAMRFAAQHAHLGDMSQTDSQHVFTIAPRRMRTMFHTLVNANQDAKHSIPIENKDLIAPRIPAPAILHAYVRALGSLQDFEGLYSFANWAASHFAEITARANGQRSGLQSLFRTLVALRVCLEGGITNGGEAASSDLVELVKAQVESVEEWDWPSDEDVENYKKGSLKGKKRSVTTLSN